MQIDFHYKVVPLMGCMSESGDLAIVKQDDNYCYLGLIDGLGHGKLAYDAAIIAHNYLNHNFTPDLLALINEIHIKMQKSRGAVMALACLNKKTGELLFSGIGNITARIFSFDSCKIVPRDGVLGHNIPTPRLQKFNLNSNEAFVMYSDGVKESMDMLDCPGLLNGTASEITEQLFNKYAKTNDDASLITLKAI